MNKLNIGITKFGSVMNETRGLNNSSGSMLEVFNLVNILSKQHNVYFTNNLRKPQTFKHWNNEPLDILLVFNGPVSKNNDPARGHPVLEMFKGYGLPVIRTINALECPYIYIMPDVRYKITRISPEELHRWPSKTVTLLGDEDYVGFDKLWMYNRKINTHDTLEGLNKFFNSADDYENKSIVFGLMYNDTNNRKTKMLFNFIEELKKYNITTDLKGKFKNPPPENSGVLMESSYYDWLKKVKYTVHIASKPLQITTRIWDGFLNGVIGFLTDFDEGFKVIPKDHFLRLTSSNKVKELADKINILENNIALYNELLEYQYSLVKEEYLNGEFILNQFNNMFEEVISGSRRLKKESSC